MFAGMIVDGLGGKTHYVLLGRKGPLAGQMAVPINPTIGAPEVVELADGFNPIIDAGGVLAKFGPKVAKIRRKYNLPQPRG